MEKKGPRQCRSPSKRVIEVSQESLVFLDLEFCVDDIVIIRVG